MNNSNKKELKNKIKKRSDLNHCQTSSKQSVNNLSKKAVKNKIQKKNHRSLCETTSKQSRGTCEARSPHQIAFEILQQVIFNKKHLSEQFGLYPDIPAFSKDLCFKTCRFYFVLKDILKSFMQKPLKDNPKNHPCEVALLMGLCQLIYLDIKDHAAVNETLKCLNTPKILWCKKLVNAILRSYLRKGSNNKDKSLKTSPWLYNQLITNWPEQADDIIKAMLKHPPMSMRINTQKISPKDYKAKLDQANISYIDPKIDNLEEAIIIDPPIATNKIPGFYDGLISVQDIAAQYCTILLDPKPNEIILDACAAPGGKLSHIIQIQPDLKKLIGFEVDIKRFTTLNNSLKRLDLDNNSKLEVYCQDAINLQNKYADNYFDKILIDAPCSATGIIRRQPDIQIHRCEDDLKLIKNTQIEILKSLWPKLKAGGHMLYATCSILKDENDAQIEKFLELFKDASTLSFNLPFGQKTKFGWQILPNESSISADGFYYSIIYKNKA